MTAIGSHWPALCNKTRVGHGHDTSANEDDDATTTMTGTLHVKFAKGVQGRGYFEEDVDYLPLDILQNVVRAIYPVNPEALRPENLALLSL